MKVFAFENRISSTPFGYNRLQRFEEAIITSKIGSLGMAVLSILMGIFFIYEIVKDPDRSDIKGFIFLGIFAIFAGIFIFVFTVKQMLHEKKVKATNENRRTYGAIRRADNVKCRILLEAECDGMKICYRRVKSVNELVINGSVYDEYRNVLEFEHELVGKYGDHTVKAGLDEDSQSYISVNGVRIAVKTRHI